MTVIQRLTEGFKVRVYGSDNSMIEVLDYLANDVNMSFTGPSQIRSFAEALLAAVEAAETKVAAEGGEGKEDAG